MSWGLYDTRDHVWLGSDEGPLRYDDFLIARIAAQVMDTRLGWEPGRTRATELPAGPGHVRDAVEPTMTGAEAVARQERGDW